MQAIAFVIVFTGLGMLGYFLVGRVDKFIASGNIVPAEPPATKMQLTRSIEPVAVHRLQEISAPHLRVRARPMRILVVGFAVVILTGALLLSLPAASRNGTATPFPDALFTATSATCVTGLVIYDTHTHWSMFGQLVILSLIQIGGLGFMTVVMYVLGFTHHKFGLAERSIMQESISAQHLGGIVRTGRFVVTLAALIEAVGALLLSFRFIPQFGVLKGIYYAVFHAISAFCNAGFDLMGVNAPFSSLTSYAGDPLVSGTIIALIVCGGLGFIVWEDIVRYKWRFRRYGLHAKIALTMACVLIIGGAVLLFAFELRNPAFAARPPAEQALTSLFQSVTPRTAGFNTVDLTSMTGASTMLIICLMLIGASPGSTAGGVKTTTFAVLILCIVSVVRKREYVECYQRRIDDTTIKKAFSVFFIYTFLTVAVTTAIAHIDHISLRSALFESASAIGTVGLSLGITPALGMPSHMLLAFLMYFGRVGCLTLVYFIAERIVEQPNHLPLGNVVVG